MNASAAPFTEIAAEWRQARQLYPLYKSLADQFAIDVPVCPEMESPDDNANAITMLPVRHWFNDLDERIEVHQLRHFLQTSPLANEETLRLLGRRVLQRESKKDADRDKLDFLLVQYFAHCVPTGLDDADIDLNYVAEIMEPVLGQITLEKLDWIEPLHQVLSEAQACHSLSEWLEKGLLERGRQIKLGSGDKYFNATAMIAFIRFNFLVRRSFFRLMHTDLEFIQKGLQELEKRGATTVDCRVAQLAEDEPIFTLRQICQSWRELFRAEYSVGQPMKLLVDIRVSVDAALTGKPAVPINPPPEFRDLDQRQPTTSPEESHAAGADAQEFKVEQPTFSIDTDPTNNDDGASVSFLIDPDKLEP
jgi:hypothetical protein